ncbi:hypothetical protein PD280_06245 [Virgibacillus salarius]|uniref:hypothetical protein n=1 Tax=Virgibacillus salarius TaxID=447199 RepID=UPI0024911C16|nr:hypothetical protein [Virgibacillus salarius]WBX81318.1 hypothetical protein PD280_06245 [Virgibacillus salarius]
MNTASESNIPLLPKGVKYRFILEDLELAFSEKQLKNIVSQWEYGRSIEDIAEINSRNPHEIFLALYDQARKENIKRPFAYRIGRSRDENNSK